MTETGESREDRAFREAFERRAGDYRPVPLALPRRRRTWPAVVAAAAAVVLVAGVAAAVTTIAHQGTPRMPISGVTSGMSSPSSDGTPGPTAVEDVDTLPPADDGWQWVSWRDVAVQVPASWVYSLDEPGFGCGRSTPPKDPTPVILTQRSTGIDGGVGCTKITWPADMPEQMRYADGLTTDPADWRAHVSLGAWTGPLSTAPDLGTWSYDGWTLTTRMAADVVVTVLDRSSDAAVIHRVMGSALGFLLGGVDQNGCTASSPVQGGAGARPPAMPSTGTDVVSVSICQYDVGRWAGQAALEASRLLTGQAAVNLVDAIAAAPSGGGPDDPQDCLDKKPGPARIELVVHHANGGTSSLYVHYSACAGNGIDDGTVLHRLTLSDCSPLFARLPVAFLTGQTPVADACGLTGK